MLVLRLVERPEVGGTLLGCKSHHTRFSVARDNIDSNFL